MNGLDLTKIAKKHFLGDDSFFLVLFFLFVGLVADDLYGKLLRAVLLSSNSYSSHGIPPSVVSKLHAFLPKATSGVICEMPLR